MPFLNGKRMQRNKHVTLEVFPADPVKLLGLLKLGAPTLNCGGAPP